MNRERHRYWSAYIADVQGRMLAFARGRADATVAFRGPAHAVRIYLSEDFDANTRAAQRETIVHELLHCHLNPLDSHLALQVKHWEAGSVMAAKAGHRSHEEYVVDDLARIIAPSMPLPPKVKA
jgi:hypothetical protein